MEKPKKNKVDNIIQLKTLWQMIGVYIAKTEANGSPEIPQFLNKVLAAMNAAAVEMKAKEQLFDRKIKIDQCIFHLAIVLKLKSKRDETRAEMLLLSEELELSESSLISSIKSNILDLDSSITEKQLDSLFQNPEVSNLSIDNQAIDRIFELIPEARSVSSRERAKKWIMSSGNKEEQIQELALILHRMLGVDKSLSKKFSIQHYKGIFLNLFNSQDYQ